MVKIIKNNLLLFVLILLSLPTIWALTHQGFFLSDDGEWMIIRLSAFYETLRSGQIPVRMIARLNNSYGYPLGNFIYPAYLYLGSIIHLMGFGFIASVKIIFGLSMILSGMFTYFWLKNLFPKLSAFFAALVYVYSPYHLFDFYTRGSIGEMLALCVLPFILWQIERKDFVFTSLGIGLLVLSHNTLAFLLVLPLYAYLIFRTKENGIKKFLYPMVPFFTGALLSVFFWFPAIYDLQYTRFQTVLVSEWHKYFADTSLIGYSSFIIISLFLLVLFMQKKKTIKQGSLVYFFLALSLLSLFLSFPISAVFWSVLPSSLVQFPFRFLSLLIPCLAYVVAYTLSFFSGKKRIVIGVAIFLLSFISSYPYLFPKGYANWEDAYYVSNFSTTTVKDEYMPKWVTRLLPEARSKKGEIIQGSGVIEEEKVSPNSVELKMDVVNDGVLQINAVYFPGWKVWIDGKETGVMYNNPLGMIQVPIPPGKHTVHARFVETEIRLVTDIISLLTLSILLILLFTKVRYNAIKLI